MDNSRSKTSPAVPTEGAREGGDGRLVPSREGGGEGFVGRWSRLKAEAREGPLEKTPAPPSPADPQAPPPDVPPPETLTFDSDYRQFLHPKVEEGVRRAALKKLFSDPHFNVMDGLDIYIDDYSKTEPIPAAMLAGLKQAQNIFQWAKEDAEARDKARSQAQDATRASDEPPAVLESPEAGHNIGGPKETPGSGTAPGTHAQVKGSTDL